MKKVYFKSIIAGAVLAGLSQQAAMADELPAIHSIQDTWVTLGDSTKTNNFGDKPIMKIDRDFSGFVQFDIPALPSGQIIDKVILKLKASSAIPDTFIRELTNPQVEWDETVVHASSYPFTLGDKIPGAVIGSAETPDDSADFPIQEGEFHEFDITSAVSGIGKYTFNIDMENTSLGNIKWVAGAFGSESTDRAALVITTIAGEVDPADLEPPYFEGDIPPVTIPATGIMTDISSFITVTAEDVKDPDPINATVVGDTNLVSGTHEVKIVARDSDGNTSDEATVVVNITPLAEVTTEKSGVPVGGNALVSVKVLGNAVNDTYPVTLSYAITGEAAEHSTGTITFADEAAIETAQTVEIAILADATSAQSAVFTITNVEGAIIPDPDFISIRAVTGNEAPEVSLTLKQKNKVVATIDASNALSTHLISAKGGDVTVSATIFDVNEDDTHALSWDKKSTKDATIAEDIFTFTPVVGMTEFSATATETFISTEADVDTAKLFDTLTAKIRVIEKGLPTLPEDETDTDKDGIPDKDEGLTDSDNDGILDYLDSSLLEVTQLQLAADDTPLQTSPGLTLSLGSVSKTTKGIAATSAVITLKDLIKTYEETTEQSTTDNNYFALEGANLINFTVNGVTSGGTAAIVYPLPKDVVLTENTEFRKFTPSAGWLGFTQNGVNTIASAMKDTDSNCPAPLHESYTSGLTAGHDCIQLVIEDGGIYDADGLANGSIEDPGMLAESNFAPTWDTDNIEINFSVNEGLDLNFTGNIASNASDAEGDELVFSVGNKSLSWLTVVNTGEIMADLTGIAEGIYTEETVRVQDTKKQSADTKVTVTVSINKAPVFTPIELAAAAQNVAYSATIAEQVTDAEGNSYVFNKIDGPHWLKVSETGELTGTPRAADVGVSTITIDVVDEDGARTPATIEVTVNDTNVRASKAGSFSTALLTILGLVSLRRRKQK